MLSYIFINSDFDKYYNKTTRSIFDYPQNTNEVKLRSFYLDWINKDKQFPFVTDAFGLIQRHLKDALEDTAYAYLVTQVSKARGLEDLLKVANKALHVKFKATNQHLKAIERTPLKYKNHSKEFTRRGK